MFALKAAMIALQNPRPMEPHRHLLGPVHELEVWGQNTHGRVMFKKTTTSPQQP